MDILGRITTVLGGLVSKRGNGNQKGNARSALHALMAELASGAEEIEQVIAATPDRPRASDVARLKRLNRKSRSLTARIKRTVKGDAGKQFLQTARRYHDAIIRMGEKLNQMQKEPNRRVR